MFFINSWRPGILVNLLRDHTEYNKIIVMIFLIFIGISCVYVVKNDFENKYLPLGMIYYSVLGLILLTIIRFTI
jgi:hypothetical protein